MEVEVPRTGKTKKFWKYERPESDWFGDTKAIPVIYVRMTSVPEPPEKLTVVIKGVE